MKDNLEYLAQKGVHIPVVLGGAALTRAFVEQDCQAVYPAPVFYALDAFEGLRVMEKLCSLKATLPEGKALEWNPQLIDEVRSFSRGQFQAGGDGSRSAKGAGGADVGGAESGLSDGEGNPGTGVGGIGGSQNLSGIKVLRKGESKVSLDARGQSSWVKKDLEVPVPPFFGTQILGDSISDVFEYLDDFALIRSRWGFQKGGQSEEDFAAVLRDKGLPALEHWRGRILKEGLLRPKAIYGYFPACSRDETLLVYHPSTKSTDKVDNREVLVSFQFPRQKGSRKLCISDFYKHEDSGELDVVGVQLVTMGNEASEFAKSLYDEQRFSEYFLYHGLTTELTEAYAEKVHKRIRTELGIAGRDASLVRQLFSQGYQGSRYSFGYPACPEMELNEPLLKLLGSERIGVELSESFQMHPEQSTSAIVTWHPQARYFSAL